MELPGDQHASIPRARSQRSRITNKPHRPAISGRSALGRRLRDLGEFYAEALGGWSALTVVQAEAVRRAAEMRALAEQARADALRNGGVGIAEADQLIRLENAAHRSVRALGIDRKREPEGMTLQEYAASRRNNGDAP
jgi:hypothetical protein